MPNEPQIETLSYQKRNLFFWFLVIVFLVALPSLIFYTTGYRLQFEDESTSIVTTGGMYITTNILDVEVYIDDGKVEKPRLFRSAYYIQDVEAGKHRVIVQKPDYYTWVKELPVDPYIVIEASAFNMPVLTHLRPITEYVTATGTAVYFNELALTDILLNASTTETYLISSTTATTTYRGNEEFVFVESLFSSSSTSSVSVFAADTAAARPFKFSTTTDEVIATTTEVELKESGGINLSVRAGEVFATWQNSNRNIPYYFCIPNEYADQIAYRYGEHIGQQFENFANSTSSPIVEDNNRKCRTEIRIDRKWQDVYFYDFLPNSSDLVLLQLQDGLYVTEIDDRAWQNTQKIFSGSEFRVVIENNSIFIAVDDLYFELITEIEEN